MARELALQGLCFQLQLAVPVEYKGIRLDCSYRIDVLVENPLILELTAVETILVIHKAQIVSYMKLAGIGTGLLLNFNVEWLKDGITRFKL